MGRHGPEHRAAAPAAELRRRSSEFAALWESGDVAVRRVDRKHLHHPSLGDVEIDCHRVPSEDGRQRLVWFTAAPGSPSRERLDLLAAMVSLGRERSPSRR